MSTSPPASSSSFSRSHADLRSLLASREDAFSWAGARGFVSAVAAMPSPPPPSRWMAGVIGTESRATAPQLQRIVAALIHLLDETVVAFRRGPLPLPPEGDEMTAFVQGYLAASRLDGRWLEDEATLAELEVLERLADGVADRRPALESALTSLFERWASTPGPDHGPERSEPVPHRARRNDPCPCGSGRKLKRCCGS